MSITRSEFKAVFKTLDGGAGAGALHRLLEAADLHLVEPGEVLLREGEQSRSIWFVREGSLAVRLVIDGRDTEVGRVAEGSLVGEVSFLEEGPCTATVVADSPAVLLRVQKELLDRLASEDPAIPIALLQAVAQELSRRVLRAGDELVDLQARYRDPSVRESLMSTPAQPGEGAAAGAAAGGEAVPEPSRGWVLDTLRTLLGLRRS